MIRFLRLMRRLIIWLHRMQIQQAARGERDRFTVVFFPLVGVVLTGTIIWGLFDDPAMTVLTAPLTVPIAVGALSLGLLEYSVPWVRRRNVRRTQAELDTNLRDDWYERLEALLLIQEWEKSTERPRMLKGHRIWWRVLDIDPPGNRILVEPMFDSRTRVVICEDLHVDYEFHFISVEPHIQTIPGALEWSGTLPRGTWHRAERVEI